MFCFRWDNEMKEMYDRVRDLGYDPRHRDAEGILQAFCMAFCRTMRGGNVLVKGNYDRVREYIVFGMGPCLVSYSLWYHGKARNILRFENSPFQMCRNYSSVNGEPLRGWKVLRKSTHKVLKTYRRVPSTFPLSLYSSHSAGSDEASPLC